jgi:hypothetical protein
VNDPQILSRHETARKTLETHTADRAGLERIAEWF